MEYAVAMVQWMGPKAPFIQERRFHPSSVPDFPPGTVLGTDAGSYVILYWVKKP